MSGEPVRPDHVIRLRGPWNYRVEQPASAGGLVVTGVVELPGGWSAAFPHGAPPGLVLNRRFGRPTGISPGDRVELVVEAVGTLAEILLNGEPQWDGATPATRIDVSGRLGSRNELQISVGDSAEVCEARLEIYHAR